MHCIHESDHRSIWAALEAAGMIALLFLSVISAAGQERRREFNLSTPMRSPLALDTMQMHSRPSFFLPPSFIIAPQYDPDFVRRTRAIYYPFLPGAPPNNFDLVPQWKQILAKDNQLQTLQIILGSIEAGAAAYVAYEHIRKYGFY